MTRRVDQPRRGAGLRLRRVSVMALVGLLTLAGVVGWITHRVVEDQEARLLKGRANEVGLVFTVSISTVPSTLGVLGGILKSPGASTAQFDQAAAAEVAASPGKIVFALLRPVAGGFEVVAAEGQGLAAGQVLSDSRAATLRQAMRVRQMVATPVVGPSRLLGFAIGPPVAPAGTVLYRQSQLGPVSPPRQASTAPFNELRVVVYASPHPDPKQVLASTTPNLPLESAHYQSLQAGSSTWLLGVSATRPLVGSTASAAPWAVLIGGIFAALLVALVIEVEGRSRDVAVELYASEHRVAETLQRSLLPDLPALGGLDLAARYLAGASGQEVGGDWFDVFPVEGDRVGVVIGDVMGHDVVAAAAMSQIRAAVRAYAWQGQQPAAVLDQLDRLVTTFQMTPLVSVFYGVLEPEAPDGGRLLRYATAGHLPPILQTATGEVQTLSDGCSMVICGLHTEPRAQAEIALAAGSTLLLFTDGLLETPGGSIDDALGRLVAEVTGHQPAAGADVLCDRLLSDAHTRQLADDVALLVVRLHTDHLSGPAAPDRDVGVRTEANTAGSDSPDQVNDEQHEKDKYEGTDADIHGGFVTRTGVPPNIAGRSRYRPVDSG